MNKSIQWQKYERSKSAPPVEPDAIHVLELFEGCHLEIREYRSDDWDCAMYCGGLRNPDDPLLERYYDLDDAKASQLKLLVTHLERGLATAKNLTDEPVMSAPQSEVDQSVTAKLRSAIEDTKTAISDAYNFLDELEGELQ